MLTFLKITTQMFPAERIQKLNLNASINGELGIEVTLFGIPETFQYTGQYASLAYDVLKQVKAVPAPPQNPPSIEVHVNGVGTPVSALTLNNNSDLVEYRFVTLPGTDETIFQNRHPGETINVDNIEWVDFAAQVNGTQSVQIDLATDAPGVIRSFFGNDAGTVCDALAVLASNPPETETAWAAI